MLAVQLEETGGGAAFCVVGGGATCVVARATACIVVGATASVVAGGGALVVGATTDDVVGIGRAEVVAGADAGGLVVVVTEAVFPGFDVVALATIPTTITSAATPPIT